ncbi:MAG: hypothetical protein SGCHY_003992 [Lobulomycetales sp.]
MWTSSSLNLLHSILLLWICLLALVFVYEFAKLLLASTSQASRRSKYTSLSLPDRLESGSIRLPLDTDTESNTDTDARQASMPELVFLLLLFIWFIVLVVRFGGLWELASTSPSAYLTNASGDAHAQAG